MKNAVLGTLFVFLLIAVPGLMQRPWPGVSIDLKNCQPSGPTAKISRAWNPLSFWAEQYVTLQMALESSSLQDLVEDCQLKESGSTEKAAKCTNFYRERHANMKKCLEFSATQCRREGGRC